MGPRRGILKQSPEARGAAKSSGQQLAHGPPLLVGNEDYEEEDKAMISGLLGRSGYESGGRPPCVDNGVALESQAGLRHRTASGEIRRPNLTLFSQPSKRRAMPLLPSHLS